MNRTMLCLVASAVMACGGSVSTNATTTTAAKMEARSNGRAPLPPPSPPPTVGEPRTVNETPLPQLGGGTMSEAPRATVQTHIVTQGSDRGDLHITARLRSAVLDDDSLSDAAKHVRIVTQGRRVLLTGAVPTARERENIDAKARNFPGVLDVENDIVVGPVQ